MLFLVRGAMMVVLAAVTITSARADDTSSPSVAAANSTLPPNATGHGGILCIWSILLSIREAGDHCITPKDIAFQAALDSAIDRIDLFIEKYAPSSSEKLNALKRSRPLTDLKSDVCIAKPFYERYRQLGAAKLSEDVTDLLAVPRKPEWGPCL